MSDAEILYLTRELDAAALRIDDLQRELALTKEHLAVLIRDNIEASFKT